MRTAEAEVFDLANRGLHLVNEGIMLSALDMNGLVRTENRRRPQPFGDLRILRATVDPFGNGLSVIDWHRFLGHASFRGQSHIN